MESLGLSTVHISPQFIHGVSVASECHVDVYSGGQLVEFSIDKQVNSLKAKREKRGRVESFSKASRRRLFRKVAKINKNEVKPPLFITLTYPMFFPNASETYKRHLDDFCKRFARRFPDGFLFWKLEFQRRGAAHYHLMIFGVDSVDKEWLSQAWYEVVGSGDEKHLKAGTQVQRSNGWKAVLAYCGKYMGKLPRAVDEEVMDVEIEEREVDGEVWVNYSADVSYVGRFWGLRNTKAYYSTLTQERYTVSFGAFCKAKRTLRRYVESQLRLPKHGRKGRKRKLFRRAREGCAAFISDVGARRIIEHVLMDEMSSLSA